MIEITATDREFADRIVLTATHDIEQGNHGGTEWLVLLLAVFRLQSIADYVAGQAFAHDPNHSPRPLNIKVNGHTFELPAAPRGDAA